MTLQYQVQDFLFSYDPHGPTFKLELDWMPHNAMEGNAPQCSKERARNRRRGKFLRAFWKEGWWLHNYYLVSYYISMLYY